MCSGGGGGWWCVWGEGRGILNNFHSRLTQTRMCPALSLSAADPYSVPSGCTKFSTTGYHAGRSIASFTPQQAPDGELWTWHQWYAPRCCASCCVGGLLPARAPCPGLGLL